MASRVRLSVILSTDEALNNLGTFAFVASHLLSAFGCHSSDLVDLLRLVESLEEIHTEVQGMVSSPHLAPTLLYDALRRWGQYLNKCVAG